MEIGLRFSCLEFRSILLADPVFSLCNNVAGLKVAAAFLPLVPESVRPKRCCVCSQVLLLLLILKLGWLAQEVNHRVVVYMFQVNFDITFNMLLTDVNIVKD